MKNTTLTILMFVACLGLWQTGYSIDHAVHTDHNASSGLTDDQAIKLMGEASPTLINLQGERSESAVIDDVAINLNNHHVRKSLQKHDDYLYTDKVLTDTDIIVQYQKENPYQVQPPGQILSKGLTDNQAIELSKDYYGINPNSPASYYSTPTGNGHLMACCSFTVVSCTCKEI